MTKEIEEVIENFFDEKTPKIYCLSGKWGIGKTYLFNEIANKKNSKFINISLFGVSSIDDLKLKIKLEKLSQYTPKKISSFIKIIKKISFINKINFVGAGIQFDFSKISIEDFLFDKILNELTICFDDIERRASGLQIDEFFGLISTLKEKQKCKIFLILNDEELKDEEWKKYKKYFEKAVDHDIKFNRHTDDSIEIIFEKNKNDNFIKLHKNFLLEKLKILEINNIRIIDKLFVQANFLIERLNKIKSPQQLEAETKQHALMVLFLFLDGKYSPKNENRPTNDEILSPENKIYNDEKYRSFLWKYGYYNFSKLQIFEKEINDFIENGYFSNNFDQIAIEYNKVNIQNSKKNRFSNVWREEFHGSFKGKQVEVVNKIYNTFIDGIDEMSINELNSIYQLLKDLSDERLKDLLDIYFNENKHKKEEFEKLIFLNLHPEIVEYVKTCKEKILLTNSENFKIDYVIEMVYSLAKNNEERDFYWNRLKQFSRDDFYNYFINSKKDNRFKIQISKDFDNAKSAMQDIENISKLNKLRIEYLK